MIRKAGYICASGLPPHFYSLVAARYDLELRIKNDKTNELLETLLKARNPTASKENAASTVAQTIPKPEIQKPVYIPRFEMKEKNLSEDG